LPIKAFPTLNGYQPEKVNEIMYCKADQNYTEVYTLNGKMVMVSKPLNVIEKLLADSIFFRIHQSCLVKLNYVKTYSSVDGFPIVLENGIKLDVAASRKDDFIRVVSLR
jgi:two-component system LytT family response regulator